MTDISSAVSGSLRRAGITLIAVTAIAKLVGYLREAVVASALGTSRAVDLYLAATTIPILIGTVVYHSIPNAFVPLFAPPGESSRRVRRAAWVSVTAMFGLSVAIWILARPLALATAAGFGGADQAEAMSLLRVGAWSIGFATIEALSRSRLIARKHFAWPGLAFVWQSAAVVAAIGLWPQAGARALAWGYLCGTGLAALWNLVPSLRVADSNASGPIAAPAHGRQSPTQWVVAAFLVDAIAQVFALVDRWLGSYLAPGSIAALQYANLVAFIPFSVVGLALATASFPFLAESVAARDASRTEAVLDSALRGSLLVIVPVMVWMLVFPAEIVTLLFARGAFGADAVRLTASALALFALALLPSVVANLWSRVFYASRSWRPILRGSLAGLVTKTVLGVWWVQTHGVAGLAAATAAGYGVWVLWLLRELRPWVTSARMWSWARHALLVFTLAAIPSLTVAMIRRGFLPESSGPDHGIAALTIGAAAAATVAMIFLIGRRSALMGVAPLQKSLLDLIRSFRGR